MKSLPDVFIQIKKQKKTWKTKLIDYKNSKYALRGIR